MKYEIEMDAFDSLTTGPQNYEKFVMSSLIEITLYG